MNHKEKMQYLKEHDPMLYYELNSDPTGGGIEFSLLGFIVIVTILTVCFILCWNLL